jgi:chromosomal replication initiator protein
MDEKHSQLWQKLSAALKPQVSPDTFKRWFSAVKLVQATDETFTFRVPNNIYQFWIESNHMAALQAAIVTAFGSPRHVKFATALDGTTKKDEEELPEISSKDLVRESGRDGKQSGGAPGLNPRNSFESFVVGPNNEIAHAASLAVAKTPARTYNPLFIYGGVGLGKTHLMHAVGHYVLLHDRNLKLTYISSERFMNEMINAVRYDGVLDFRERYRSVDVLLVDDIQFLAGKEGTQTEFFHTFNALYDSQKQIVLSSDCPPHEIPALEERLRSRFEWGLIADIQPPDLETKVAILKKKAEAETVPLPDDVALYIAGKIKSNIRELEGSLIRLIAYASLTGQEISLALAQDVLKNILGHEEKAVTIEIIQKFVADYYNLKLIELKSRNNSKSVAMPRQVAMYLCKSLTHASLPEIGRSFGGKHHSTVIHSIRKVELLRKKDGNFNSLIGNFLEGFR